MIPFQGKGLPRSLVILTGRPISASKAEEPRVHMIWGLIILICPIKRGLLAAISAGRGRRLFGGAAFDHIGNKDGFSWCFC